MKLFKLMNLGLAAATVVVPKDLNISSAYSIRNVAATIAHETMSYYNGNTSTNPVDTGDVQDPYYWWVAGALWGAMLDYYHYTQDPSYNDVVIQALTAPTNLGPNFDYVPEEHAFEEGNDDLFFWGTAAISAAEINFPQPDSSIPSWLEIGANVFDSLASRWNDTACGGGLLWQMYADNPNGMDYKNSVSNGGFFHIAARMARATKNDTYLDWAEKVWDWSWDIGFVDHDLYHVYDGASSSQNCSVVNKVSYSYTSGVFLYGAAVMANYTGKDVWAKRTSKLLDGADWFFSPYDNATNVLYEAACEETETCNQDMVTQKGYLSRFMWQSAVLQPDLRPKVEKLMKASSKAAAQSCVGGDDKTSCGTKWYVEGFDGATGLGAEMCALETIQGLLSADAAPPLSADEIKTVRKAKWSPLDTYKPDTAKEGSKATTSGTGATHTTKTDEHHETKSSGPTKRSGAPRLVPSVKTAVVATTIAACLAIPM